MTTGSPTSAAMTMSHDVVQRAIDAHFTTRGPKGALVAVSAHLEACDVCRGYFAQREILARLDPRAPSLRDRVAHGAGLETAGRPRFALAPLGALATAGALAVALFVVGDVEPSSDGFAARGGQRALDDAAGSPVRVFRISGDESVPVAGEIDDDDELAFAYKNPDAKSHLMIFAVDERGEVYWYHPAWTDPDSNPSAVAVESGPHFRELTEAVRHDLRRTEKLRVYALFTDGATTVRSVERALGESGRAPDGAVLLKEIAVRHTR